MRFRQGATISIACVVVAINVSLAAEIKSNQQVLETLEGGSLSNQDQTQIVKFLNERYKGQNLTTGNHRHLLQWTGDGGGIAVWCIKAPGATSVTVKAEKGRSWPMKHLGDSDLWVAAEKFGNFESVHYRYDVDGTRIGGGRNGRFGFESYEWTPDSLEQKGVPRGELIEMGKHVSQKQFKGATRDWWIYVPANHEQLTEPMKLIVFNDGGGFIKGDGNATIVLDNLIHKRKIPPMVAVFFNPGEFPAPGDQQPRSNRSNEYDTCTPRFATFLEEEMLPAVFEKYNISKDPSDHAIVGSSSGASCAFTAAWHRNDLFRRVVSFVGSYCDFRPLGDYPDYGDQHVLDGDQFGPWKTAHDYPALIRKTNPPKKIKAFLQDGENDLDNQLGNWFQNNLRMDSALAYAGYDYKFVAGKGMHSKKHGMAILPEILVWLWNDE